MSMLWEALFWEASFQIFRRQHGIGNGVVNRAKFRRIFPRAFDEVMARN